ncbi:hypothetical protein DFJ73DRAFT_962100 [Zopfochytrium polystomum]|nr:hypothetical protein DFJ73DRAFT_962100 [Zopfochytrium polystomum]
MASSFVPRRHPSGSQLSPVLPAQQPPPSSLPSPHHPQPPTPATTIATANATATPPTLSSLYPLVALASSSADPTMHLAAGATIPFLPPPPQGTPAAAAAAAAHSLARMSPTPRSSMMMIAQRRPSSPAVLYHSGPLLTNNSSNSNFPKSTHINEAWRSSFAFPPAATAAAGVFDSRSSSPIFSSPPGNPASLSDHPAAAVDATTFSPGSQDDFFAAIGHSGVRKPMPWFLEMKGTLAKSTSASASASAYSSSSAPNSPISYMSAGSRAVTFVYVPSPATSPVPAPFDVDPSLVTSGNSSSPIPPASPMLHRVPSNLWTVRHTASSLRKASTDLTQQTPPSPSSTLAFTNAYAPSRSPILEPDRGGRADGGSRRAVLSETPSAAAAAAALPKRGDQHAAAVVDRESEYPPADALTPLAAALDAVATKSIIARGWNGDGPPPSDLPVAGKGAAPGSKELTTTVPAALIDNDPPKEPDNVKANDGAATTGEGPSVIPGKPPGDQSPEFDRFRQSGQVGKGPFRHATPLKARPKRRWFGGEDAPETLEAQLVETIESSRSPLPTLGPRLISTTAAPDCPACGGTQFLADSTVCNVCSGSREPTPLFNSPNRNFDFVRSLGPVIGGDQTAGTTANGGLSAPEMLAAIGLTGAAKRTGSRIAKAVGQLRIRRSSVEFHPNAPGDPGLDSLLLSPPSPSPSPSASPLQSLTRSLSQSLRTKKELYARNRASMSPSPDGAPSTATGSLTRSLSAGTAAAWARRRFTGSRRAGGGGGGPRLSVATPSLVVVDASSGSPGENGFKDRTDAVGPLAPAPAAAAAAVADLGPLPAPLPPLRVSSIKPASAAAVRVVPLAAAIRAALPLPTPETALALGGGQTPSLPPPPPPKSDAVDPPAVAAAAAVTAAADGTLPLPLLSVVPTPPPRSFSLRQQPLGATTAAAAAPPPPLRGVRVPGVPPATSS